MRVRWTRRLIGRGNLAPTKEWDDIRNSVVKAIEAVDWPIGSGSFNINPQHKANGVGPIKREVSRLLRLNGWSTEQRWPIGDLQSPGHMDGAFQSSHGIIAFEWETGNIASSHRSMNKMCLGLGLGAIGGGILAVSTRSLAQFLTDRIGNAEELQPYFPLWEATNCSVGVLEVLAVEHDRENPTTPLIPKAQVGRRTAN